jgi:hypothetical protein
MLTGFKSPASSTESTVVAAPGAAAAAGGCVALGCVSDSATTFWAAKKVRRPAW